MKKILLLGILGVIFLLVSTATAVPNTQSQAVMDTIEKIEQAEDYFDSHMMRLGFFSTLITLIINIIQLGLKIFAIYKNIMGIINLIQNLISNLQTLIELVNQIVQFITDLLNPEALRA